MGLDIFLYEAVDAAQNKAHNDAMEALYADDREVSDEEHRAVSDAHPYIAHKHVPSEQYPDHYFNRRYLRSSYNGGGFNHAVPEMLGDDREPGRKYPNEYGSLYWIFEPMERQWDGDEGTLTRDDIAKLQVCAFRARTVAKKLKKCDRLRVLTISPNMFSAPPQHSDNDALRLYREHIASRQGAPGPFDGDWYSTGGMEIFGEAGVSILCAVPGKATFDIPGVHLIYRAADEGYDFYVRAAEITAEFCDEAITLVERDGTAQLSWSG